MRPANCDVYFVHSLYGVVEDEARDNGFDGEVERDKKGQCCGVQIAHRQHHLGRAAGFAVAVGGLQLDIERLLGGAGDSEAWDEPFVRGEPGEYGLPDLVEGFSEDTVDDGGACLCCGFVDLLRYPLVARRFSDTVVPGAGP